jgi:DNA (cytosine-5)-methyltransferase 1
MKKLGNAELRPRNHDSVAHKAACFGYFSFFTGAGFLDLGFESCGFIPLAANEIEPNFAAVYRYSRNKMGIPLPRFGLQEESIANFLERAERKSWLESSIAQAKMEFNAVGFVGGPPCPDFSIAGKQAGAQGKNGQLSQVYMNAICAFLPDFFIFENVKGLLSTARHREFFNALVEQARKAGYSTDWRLLNALNYGVAQDRDRVILFGVRQECLHAGAFAGESLFGVAWEAHQKWSTEQLEKIQWPSRATFSEASKLDIPSGVPEELTVEHWFRKNDVEHHPNAADYFQPRAGLEKMRRFDEGDDSKKCYKRLHRWRYSPTAAYGNNEVHLHPYKVRRLSVAETLAIQSLPKEFELPPEISLSAKFKTIGNGVPFLLAKGVAETVKDYLVKEILP